jgi:hypothetical protein
LDGSASEVVVTYAEYPLDYARIANADLNVRFLVETGILVNRRPFDKHARYRIDWGLFC